VGIDHQPDGLHVHRSMMRRLDVNTHGAWLRWGMPWQRGDLGVGVSLVLGLVFCM
jgi:hypothetical protein